MNPTSCLSRTILHRTLLVAAVALHLSAAHAAMVFFAQTGHWYEAVNVPEGITWNEAYTNAINRGGYLCTITNASENDFVASLVDITYYSGVSVNNDILGPWLGGLRHANQSTWQWVTGEPFSYINWYPNQPDGYGGSEQRLQFYHGATVGSTWGDHPGDPIAGYSLPRGYIVEYDLIPRLGLGSNTSQPRIVWPLATLSQGWVLETAPELSSDTNLWKPVNTDLIQTNLNALVLAITNKTGNAFFRLRQ